ncbi:MAG: HAD family phosphatase [Leptolyngbya foveolarum]|uniref:HAD family phosphatase n=1 Tax=Leptolyngbya foveolarum TaxID=47253 RepID=A0A2W4UNZ6_9CYAN|nr:MAG: HAD family phosphatase [Leptolyngbya foveolarum]
MALKAALFSFSGIIINDEDIRKTLSEQVLLAENLRPSEDDYYDVCLGKSDRACLKALLYQRGRDVGTETLDKLLQKESAVYQTWLESIEKPPIYPGLEDLIFRCRAANVEMAIVTGVERQQVTEVLERAQLTEHFPLIVAGDDISLNGSKPSPDGYIRAIARLNELYPDLQLQPNECIALEDTFSGITAAKSAHIPVVGVAHTYPNHMLQRRATWVVDYLREVNFDWIGEKFGGERLRSPITGELETDSSATETSEPTTPSES